MIDWMKYDPELSKPIGRGYHVVTLAMLGLLLIGLMHEIKQSTIDLRDDGKNVTPLTYDSGCTVYPTGDDDTAAIQRVIDRAVAGGCPDNAVHLSPRNYILERPLELPSDPTSRSISIDGHGASLYAPSGLRVENTPQ